MAAALIIAVPALPAPGAADDTEAGTRAGEPHARDPRRVARLRVVGPGLGNGQPGGRHAHLRPDQPGRPLYQARGPLPHLRCPPGSALRDHLRRPVREGLGAFRLSGRRGLSRLLGHGRVAHVQPVLTVGIHSLQDRYRELRRLSVRNVPPCGVGHAFIRAGVPGLRAQGAELRLSVLADREGNHPQCRLQRRGLL